jgi:transcription initiation factor TFIID subunit TAF12
MKGCLQSTSIIMTSWPAGGCAGTVVGGAGSGMERVKLVDEDTRWHFSASRTKLRQDVRCNVVVADDVVELESIELVLELADF